MTTIELIRRRNLLINMRTAFLPKEYQEVEWIGASSSGPYIQTSVSLTNGPARLCLKYSCAHGGDYGRDYFGVRSGSRTGQQGFMIKVNSNRTDFLASSGNNSNPNAGIAETSIPYTSNSIVEVDALVSAGNAENGTITATFTVNGITETVTNAGATADNTQQALSIFGSVAAVQRPKGKIFGPAKAWNDGSLVLCAVPCYRKADGVIGMYDTVNKVFYTNAGTGSFTKGADV